MPEMHEGNAEAVVAPVPSHRQGRAHQAEGQGTRSTNHQV